LDERNQSESQISQGLSSTVTTVVNSIGTGVCSADTVNDEAAVHCIEFRVHDIAPLIDRGPIVRSQRGALQSLVGLGSVHEAPVIRML